MVVKWERIGFLIQKSDIQVVVMCGTREWEIDNVFLLFRK